MRSLDVLLLILAPVAVLIAFQGMVTVGLLPLALFGPFYAIARGLLVHPSDARREGARMVVVAALGAGLAIAPAAFLLADAGPGPTGSMGLLLIGVATGGLAALATAPASRPLTQEEERQWTIVRAIDQDHGRGLALLFMAAVPAALLLGLLREIPISEEAGVLVTLPEALLGAVASGGSLLLPGPGWPVVLVLPLTLAPLAIGFLLPVRSAGWVAGGGLVFLALAPVAVALDLPVVTGQGLVLPLSLLETPSLSAATALAPVGAGALIGAGCLALAKVGAPVRWRREAGWALTAAVLAPALFDVVGGLGVLLGLGLAAAVVSFPTTRAPTGAAIGLGVLVGGGLTLVTPLATALLVGLTVGAVVTAAALTSGTLRTLPLPAGAVRQPKTLVLGVVGLLAAGLLTWWAASSIAAPGAAFPAPHARALAGALNALATQQGALLLGWGLAAGLLVQGVTGAGVLVALGFLAGPGVGLLVVLGAVLRSLWEGHLFKRSRKGWVRRGEMGYELLRVHVLACALLAGEALAMATAGILGY